MIKVNDLVKIKGEEVKDNQDMTFVDMLEIFAGEKARVVRIINDHAVEIEYLDKEAQKEALPERLTEVLISEIEKI